MTQIPPALKISSYFQMLKYLLVYKGIRNLKNLTNFRIFNHYKTKNYSRSTLQRIRLEDLHPHSKDKYIFCIGELHTVVCALRGMGSLIESSSIDDAWICADVYGPQTTPQITAEKHTKRGVTAQTTTLIALSKLNLSHFFESHPSLLNKISPAIHAFSNERANGTEIDWQPRPFLVAKLGTNI